MKGDVHLCNQTRTLFVQNENTLEAGLAIQLSQLSKMGVHRCWKKMDMCSYFQPPPFLPLLFPRHPASHLQDAYQVCRQWTIAVFQHISESDFAVRLLGGTVRTLGSAAYEVFLDDDNDTVNERTQTRRLDALQISRSLAQTNGSYDVETDAGVDVVFSTVAIPAFSSALPSTVGLLNDNYFIAEEVRFQTWAVVGGSTAFFYTA